MLEGKSAYRALDLARLGKKVVIDELNERDPDRGIAADVRDGVR